MSGKVEEQIRQAVLKFHLSEQGVAPESVQVFLCDDAVLVRCHNVFTKAERDLAATKQGMKVIQSARRDQRALSRRRAESQIAEITGRAVPRSFYAIDTRVGEQIEVYVLE